MSVISPFATAFLAICLLGWAAPAREDEGLDIYFVDVMGGAATLIITPERESILIDSGWPGFDDRDPKRIAFVLKEVAGLDHLDHMVTTHWHTDHYGGIEGLAKRLEIKHYWDRGLPEDNLSGVPFPEGPKPDHPLGAAYRKASQGKRKALLAGDALPLQGQAKAVVLVSGRQVVDANSAANAECATAPADLQPDPSDNACSLGILVTLGNFQFLDLGDLTWNIERQLVCPIDRIGKVDVYQVTHHGMDISNNPALVRTVAPTVAIMNNGPRKGGAAATVKLLRSLPSLEALYAVHKNQATTPEDNADPKLTANSDEIGGQFIHVHVDPDGTRFSVRIGVDGEARTFTTR
jgi:beta-lactamase superfamily II metal-dependent hydrolase